MEKAKVEEENLRKLKTLFKGLKFFLNREIPREQFVLGIRSFSGEVSWDKTTGLGSTYQEDDETITHQIIDRPLVGKSHINRAYVQPQWVFDCINENMLLPVNDYLPGAVLPPHLSPFVDANEGDYIPPEKQRLIKMKLGLPVEDLTTSNLKENQETTEKKVEKKNVNVPKKEDNKNKKAANGKKEAVQAKKGASEDDEDDDEDEEEVNDMKVDLDSPEEEEEGDDKDDESDFNSEEEEVLPKKEVIDHFLRNFLKKCWAKA